ncbi:unnamed protein product [Prunus armeniaca]
MDNSQLTVPYPKTEISYINQLTKPQQAPTSSIPGIQVCKSCAGAVLLAQHLPFLEFHTSLQFFSFQVYAKLKVRLLWAASRKYNFDLNVLESKAQDAEDRLETVASQKMVDIVTEQWIQIHWLEQALHITQFLFGAKIHEVPKLRVEGSPKMPLQCARWSEMAISALKTILNLCDTVDGGKDFYLLGSDFESYLVAQAAADKAFADPIKWTQMSISLAQRGRGDFAVIFASEYQIDGDCCSVSTFLKFVINRSGGNATVLKLPKLCTVSWPCDFKFTSKFIGQQTHEPRADWQVEKFGDLSKSSVHGRVALSILKLMSNIKYLNLKTAKVNRDGLVTLLRGCKDLVMLDARECSSFDENNNEISKLALILVNLCARGSEFREFLHGMDNFVIHVDGYSFHLHVEEMWDEMLNDLRDAFNDLGDEE